MASNNYTMANVVPSADTFREWVDLTNRITYDMEKVVVTVAANTQGARTSGNGSVNGYFSANTLIVEQEMYGATATGSVYGTRAAKDNLIIVSNTVFKANGAQTGAILFAQSNAYFTGANVEFSSNVSINSTASVFSSNAHLNDFNSNVDIDNALTTIHAGNTTIGGNSSAGEFNVFSNAAFEANVSMDAHTVELSSNNVKITANTDLFQSNATLNDFNSNVAINAANVYIEATNTHIGGSAGAELNVDANTVFTANVNITDAAADLNIGADVVTINTSATTFQSNAGTNIFNTPLDINANMDVDNAITDFNSSTKVAINGPLLDINSTTVDIDSATLVDINVPDLNVSGANVTISSDQVDIAAADALFVKGANTTIGDASTDLLRVNANTTLFDELKVVKDADFDAAVNVDGATTLNGTVTLGNATGDDLTFTGYAATGITPKANGSLSLGTTGLRWDGQFDDLVAQDLTVDNNAGITNNLTVDNNTQLDGTLTVNTALEIIYTGSGSSVRQVTIGNGVTTDDRLIVKSQVGNTTVGLMPLQGNNVPLGNNTNRWVITGKTGTFSSTLAAGDTTITGFMKASGEVEGGSLDINGVADISGNADLHGGLDLEGLFAHTSGAHNVTGAATFGDTLGVTGATTLSSTLGVTGISTLANKLIVNNTTDANATVASIKTTGGILAAKDIKTTAAGNFGSVNVTGSIDVDTNANVDGNLVVGGTTTLGDAVGDTVTVNGNVSRMVPSVNSASLGINTKRWSAALMTANTATTLDVGTVATIGTSLDVGTFATIGTDLTVGDDILMANTGNVVFSNTGEPTWTKTTISGNNISVDYLQVQKGLSFPSDTVILVDSLGGTELTVSNNVHFTGAGMDDPTFKLGDGANNVLIDSTAGRFTGGLIPNATNSKDIGTASLRWKDEYLSNELHVGSFVTGTSGTLANTTAIETGTVFARDDLVASYASDKHLKDKVLVIDNPINKLQQISGYSYVWNNNIEDHRVGTKDYGVIAQEIEEIMPEAVRMNARGHKTVNYNALIPLLIEAVKDLSAKVDYYMQADIEGDEE